MQLQIITTSTSISCRKTMITRYTVITLITYTKNYPQSNLSKSKYYKQKITHQIWDQIFVKENSMKTIWGVYSILMPQLFNIETTIVNK